MAWPSGRGPKGPFGFYRLQVIVTLCSQVPWRSIGGTTAPLSSIPFEADPLFPQHPGKELGEQRVSWPRGVERDPEGPEASRCPRDAQRDPERPTKIWIPIGLPFHFLRECAVLPICLEPIFTLQGQIATAMLQANGLKISLST